MGNNINPRVIVGGLAAWLIAAFCCSAEPVGPLTGRVVDEAGRPLAGAKVILAGAEEGAVLGSVVTGPDGRFSFDGQLRKPRATLIAAKEGKGLDWDESFHTGTAEPVLRLGPAATIGGTVVNEAGKPIAAATLRASLRIESPTLRDIHYRSAGGLLTVVTDAQGKFTFRRSAGRGDGPVRYLGPRPRLVVCDWAVPAHQEGLPRTAARGPVGRRGRGESNGKPLAGIRLAVLGAVTGEPHFVETKTDARGRFQIAGLGEDSYDIEIVGANRPDAVAIGNSTFFSQELPEWIGSQQAIHVEAGKPAAQVKIEATKGGTATLVLTDRTTHQADHVARGILSGFDFRPPVSPFRRRAEGRRG